MSFTRSASGLANYRKFCKADLVIYTEGKQDATESARTPDEVFYTALFEGLVPNIRVKVKPVGNRDSAFAYVELLNKKNIPNTIVAVDRDAFGITCSIIDSPRLIYTYGYSWENDLWSAALAKSVLRQIALASAETEQIFEKAYANGARRLKLLSALDLASNASHAYALFPKNGRSCGIRFESTEKAPIPCSEKRRLIYKYRTSPARNCNVSAQIFATAVKKPKDQVIQGHLWECFIAHLITWLAKKTCGLTKPCNDLLRNLAFSHFSSNVHSCLGAEKHEYYLSAIRKKLPELHIPV